MRDELGDRIKARELPFSSYRTCDGDPVLIRLDGKAFHTLTRGLDRPFDTGFVSAMDDTAWDLVNYTNARLGFVQSDEISLLLYNDNPNGQIFFNGRIQKLCSILASYAAIRFYNNLKWAGLERLQAYEPLFDCRVFTVGQDKMEAANVFVWREKDAERNAILTLGQYYNGHKWCMNKSTAEVAEWLDNETAWHKYYGYRLLHGMYIRRVKEMRKLTTMELDELPEKHNARQNPDLEFERTQTRSFFMNLARATNKVEVVFNGACPEYAKTNTISRRRANSSLYRNP